MKRLKLGAWIAGYIFFAGLGIASGQTNTNCPPCSAPTIQTPCPPNLAPIVNSPHRLAPPTMNSVIPPAVPNAPSLAPAPNLAPVINSPGATPSNMGTPSLPSVVGSPNLSPSVDSPGSSPSQSSNVPQTTNTTPQTIPDLPQPSSNALPPTPEAGQNDTPFQIPSRIARPTDASGFASDESGLGSNITKMMGDFFGASRTAWVVPYQRSFTARGDIISGGPGDPFSVIGFETGPDAIGNDFFSVGLGRDQLTPSPAPDTFDITEPLPGSDAMIPGSEFGFAGGTAQNASGTFADGDIWGINYNYETIYVVPNGAGLNVGRMKIAENQSVLPQDRVFFNYSMFANAGLSANGVDVNRFTPGFEKTFFDGDASIEVRTPFASTLSSNLVVNSSNDLNEVEFGDIFVALKLLLYQNDHFGFGCGMTLSLPTADDMNLFSISGDHLISIENQSVNLGPYIGWAAARNRWFTQGFLQVDVDLNGDAVHANEFDANLQPLGLRQVGTLHQQTHLYIDKQVGYWVFKDRCYKKLRGLAITGEAHYTRSLQEADVVQIGTARIGQPRANLQILSLLAGATFDMSPTTVSLGYATQVGNGSDQQFDGELRLILNRRF